MKKIVYDFDGTLTPFPIPRLSILEKCGYDEGAMTPRFVSEVKKEWNLRILIYIHHFIRLCLIG